MDVSDLEKRYERAVNLVKYLICPWFLFGAVMLLAFVSSEYVEFFGMKIYSDGRVIILGFFYLLIMIFPLLYVGDLRDELEQATKENNKQEVK